MINKDKEREGSTDAISSYNIGSNQHNRRDREHSEGKDNQYLTAQVTQDRNERGNSIGMNEYNNTNEKYGDAASISGSAGGNQISPRTGTTKNNLDKMNVMNFIKSNKGA